MYCINILRSRILNKLFKILKDLFSIFILTDNQFLVMGGMSDDSNPKDHFWSYDAESNKWKALPSMPTPRYASAAFEINNKLYVIGKLPF